jgi:hypothetical protein
VGHAEQPLGLGRQRAVVRPPDGGQLPGQHRTGDLDGDEPAEHEVVPDGEPAEYPGSDPGRDGRPDGGAGAELHGDRGAQRRVLGRQVVGQRVPGPAAGFPHHQRCRGDLGEGQRPPAARPRVARRGDDEQLIVAQHLGHEVRWQVRCLDEAEVGPGLADQLDHAGGVGDGQLDHGRLVTGGLFRGAQLDEPVRHEVLGDGLAGGDGEPVRHPGPDRAQAGLEAVGGVEHVFRPADHEPALLGEARPRRRAGEQDHAHGALQGAHAGGQRLLGDAEHAGGGGDGPLPAHLAQRPQRPHVVHRLVHQLQG